MRQQASGFGIDGRRAGARGDTGVSPNVLDEEGESIEHAVCLSSKRFSDAGSQ